MSKPARGTKRTCKSCGAKFYDLERDPIVCPACGVTFTFDEPAPKAAPEPKAKPKEPAEEEKPAATEAAEDGPEIVSLEEAAEGDEDKGPEIEDEEAIAEIEDDDTDIPDADDQDAFLEEEDEPESDVKGIIGEAPKDEGAS